MRDRDWYVNGAGQTFTVIRGPVTYQMGSTPESDRERDPDEAPHNRRIERSFAIATKEVTVREYSRFLADRPGEAADWRGTADFTRLIKDEDCPVGKVTWYEAARYCNWLSAREGLPEDQWYYPKRIGPGMKLLPDLPVRMGYRLPMEAEWEYACRAGAASARPYGRAVGWLSEYGWSGANSGLVLHPVGRLKPNDLGLFDMLGNVWEFCTHSYGPYQNLHGSAQTPIISDTTFLSQRGACLNDDVHYLRSAYRARTHPSDQNMPFGIRLARTCP